ncbi:MAG: AAA family ATPase, partial [Nitrospirae bacterium]
ALLSKYVGESERGVREVFRKAKQAAPCLVFFDEIDALVPRRSADAADSHVSERVVGQFLAELDGVEQLKGVLVLAATNRPDIIDPALLRPGRFDAVMEIPRPDERERLEILAVHTRGKPLAEDVCLATVAARTNDLTGADLGAICQRASLHAIRDVVAKPQAPSGQGAEPVLPVLIQQRHFEAALNELKKESGR